eukprot:6193201-Pleurochrysis_carterae.AAC.3
MVSLAADAIAEKKKGHATETAASSSAHTSGSSAKEYRQWRRRVSVAALLPTGLLTLVDEQPNDV